ncbi:MAG TPA: tRNA (adenosine(37)-N6)-dimethylallyltransferase MiaA [Acidimicrobiales bacterium]|nr:tRNA (adenosine(37)-N6)-dimethylallyltransferase MiaA [Acidimicrobiales bacterium]
MPVAIVGSTATGKSALALAVARAVGGTEIVSVDSMQVYRGMDIGTAKPTAADRAEVPHHLIDIAEPTEDFTVVRFRQAADDALRGIGERGNRALLAGGTGLYLRAVVDRLEPPGEWPSIRAELEREPEPAVLYARLEAMDPVAAARMTPTNRRRIIRALEVSIGSGRPFSSFGPGLTSYGATGVVQIALRVPRPVLTARIRARFEAQMAAGFLEEVASLARQPLSRTAGQALGYRELLAHLRGDIALDEAVELAITRTRQFAVRQERWFRRDPRIAWIDADDDANPLEAVLARLGDSIRCT